jgi:cytochrome c-type biogenesis protein CcmH/NrfF
MFIAPCCWRENLLVHSSPTADELRADIRKKVEAGLSDDQIKRSFLSRYSTRILAMPEGIKAQWLNWTPWLLSAGGLVALSGIVWRSVHREKPNLAPANLPELPEEEW